MHVCIYIKRTLVLKKCSQHGRLVHANEDGREGELHFSKEVSQEDGRNSHPQNAHLEKPSMQVGNFSHMLGSQTLALSTLDRASAQVMDGCCQPPARCMWTGMEQPPTPGCLLPAPSLFCAAQQALPSSSPSTGNQFGDSSFAEGSTIVCKPASMAQGTQKPSALTRKTG